MIDQPPDEQPKRLLQFGLRTLVIAQGLLALVVAMFVTHPVLGFITLLAITLGVGAVTVQPDREPIRRACFDLLAAVVLPIAALYATVRRGDFLDALLWILMLAWLPMLALIFWLARDLRQEPAGRDFRGLVAGIFAAWGFFVGVFGVIGLIAALLLAYASLPAGDIHRIITCSTAIVPAMVAFVLARNAKRALHCDWEQHPDGFPDGPFAFGIAIAAILAVVGTVCLPV